MIDRASAERFLRFSREALLACEPLVVDDVQVGLWHPRIDGAGFRRVGPIWIAEEHRGRGHASAAVRRWSDGHRARACIENDNAASQRLFAACGFTKRGRASRIAHWWRND